MTTNKETTTPGGILLTDNPPFHLKGIGAADSGGSRILLNQAFTRSGLTSRSPTRGIQPSFDNNTPVRNKSLSNETLPGTSARTISNDALLQKFEQMEKTIEQLNNEVAKLKN